MEEARAFAAELIAWYDTGADRLPWRAAPGTAAPDPYRVWLSEVMLQQTTVKAVQPRYERFLARWPTIEALAAAPEAEVMHEWAGLGYYARARSLHACARAVTAAGAFPPSEAGLRALPGIGEYTAAAIAAIAFVERVLPVDTNVARVAVRLLAEALDRAEVRLRLQPLVPAARPGDFAQAMMDLGRRVCTAARPKCGECPVARHCAANRLGLAAELPARGIKRPKPVRRGTAFWLEHRDAVLLVRRPPRGLLGGMRALPTSAWTAEEPDLSDGPAPADWRYLDSEVCHVFTHFALRLRVAVGRAGPGRPDGDWVPVSAISDAGLPTVFRKAALAALAERP